jgi:hypothetical protein
MMTASGKYFCAYLSWCSDRLRDGLARFDSRKTIFFFLLHSVQTSFRLTQPPTQWVPDAFIPWWKAAGSWSWPLISISAEVKTVEPIIPPLPICLQCTVLNYLITGTILPLFYYCGLFDCTIQVSREITRKKLYFKIRHANQTLYYGFFLGFIPQQQKLMINKNHRSTTKFTDNLKINMAL